MKHQTFQLRSKITLLLTQAILISGACLPLEAAIAQSLPAAPMPDAGRILETIKQTPTPDFSSDNQP